MPSEMRLVIQQAKYHGQVASQDVCLGTGQRLATYHADVLHTCCTPAWGVQRTRTPQLAARFPGGLGGLWISPESSGFFATATAQPGYLTLTSFNHLQHLQPSAIMFNLAMPAMPCMMLLYNISKLRPPSLGLTSRQWPELWVTSTL